MRIRTYDATDGDCLLFTSDDGHHILFDGGRKGSFVDNTLTDLGTLGGTIDLVCVSHVDNDHIQGVVRLVDSQIEHVVHTHQVATGNPNAKAPAAPQVAVSEVWHNAFDALTDDDDGTIATALAAQHRVLSQLVTAEGEATPLGTAVAAEMQIDVEELARGDRLATGYLEGIELARKLKGNWLGASLNSGFERGRPPLVKRPGTSKSNDKIPTVAVGSAQVEVLAPTHAQLIDFADVWQKWAAEHTERIAKLARSIDEIMLTTSSGQPRMVESAKRSSLTPQNLVSIVALVEDGCRTALFTGDAHQEDILAGLRAGGRLGPESGGSGSGLHLDVVKIQHHGSPNNLDDEFARQITADHYLFCGNGAHGNPSAQVVDYIIDARLARPGTADAALTTQTCDPFHLWFTAHPDRISSKARTEHMTGLYKHLKERLDETPGRFGVSVLNGPFFDVDPATHAAADLTGFRTV